VKNYRTDLESFLESKEGEEEYRRRAVTSNIEI
jgi:hypothetical protein